MTAASKMLGHNLLKNPGGEAYTQDEESYAMPDDWTWVAADKSMRAECEAYGHTGGEWDWDCAAHCGLAPGAEVIYFRFPTTSEHGMPWRGEFRQAVDLSALKDTLKARPVKYQFSTYVAGFQCHGTCNGSFVKVQFYDGAGKPIATRQNDRHSQDFHRVDESEDSDSRMFLQTPLAVADVVPENAARVEVSFGAYNLCQPEDETGCVQNYVFFDLAALVLH
jgi:hypothetical protein